MNDCDYNIGIRPPKPHIPVWVQDGATVVGRYEKPFVDRNGNSATLSMVSWKDKKGKLHESVHCVKWDKPN